MQPNVDQRSRHFQVKTGIEVIIFYFNAYSLKGENFSRQHFEIFFLFFPENRLQHCMQIVTLRDNWHKMSCLFSGNFVCVEFYGPVNPMGSCQVRSVYLTTRLLGRFSPLSG